MEIEKSVKDLADPAEGMARQGVVRATAVWFITLFILFLVLAMLGIVMRSSQAEVISYSPGLFYAIMTLHGLGMVGVMFCAGLIGVRHLLLRYIKLSSSLTWVVYVMTLIGVVGLIVATLIGKFGAGWYVLYPLPFMHMGTWENWATGLVIISLLILGVAWLLGLLDVLRGVAGEYGLNNILGWQYFQNDANKKEVPPIVLVASVSALDGVISILCGAVLLLLFLFKWLNPSLSFNPLLIKNMTFMFGHLLVNITMLLGFGIIYELLPLFSGRPWKTNKIMALAWNTSLILLLLATFHHLYMDFAQPLLFQFIGQFASYLSTIPTVAVTIVGAIGQVYHSGIKWKFTPLSFYIALISWAIGVFAAVVDSTIIVNSIFHNTLWVPAHFHTYFWMGFGLIFFGTAYHFFTQNMSAVSQVWAKSSLWVMVIGGYGVLLMFYLGGMAGIPRRFAVYSSIPIETVAIAGKTLAFAAVLSGLLFLAGLILFFISVSFKSKQEVK